MTGSRFACRLWPTTVCPALPVSERARRRPVVDADRSRRERAGGGREDARPVCSNGRAGQTSPSPGPRVYRVPAKSPRPTFQTRPEAVCPSCESAEPFSVAFLRSAVPALSVPTLGEKGVPDLPVRNHVVCRVDYVKMTGGNCSNRCVSSCAPVRSHQRTHSDTEIVVY